MKTLTKLLKIAAVLVYALTNFGLKGLLATWLLGLMIDWPITWTNVLITATVVEISIVGLMISLKSKKGA